MLTIIILGLVELTKKLGASGKLLIVLSLAIGVLASLAYSIAEKPPVTFADWVEAVSVGLLNGLAACGIYDFVTARFPKTKFGTTDPVQ